MEDSGGLKGFLQDASVALTSARLVYHPSFVAITEYDVAQNTNRYSVVFGDWERPYFHYAFPRNQWKPRYARLCSEVARVKEKHPALVSLDLPNAPDWRYCDILQSVAQEIKRLVFHVPFTGELFRDALRKGVTHNCRELGNLTSWQVEERRLAERANGHEGHWDLGIALEEFYLAHGDDRCHAYSVSFLQSENQPTVYALTAFCPGSEQGTGVAGSLPDPGKYGYANLRIEDWSKSIGDSDIATLRLKVREKLGMPTSDHKKHRQAEGYREWLLTVASVHGLQMFYQELCQAHPEGPVAFRHWKDLLPKTMRNLPS
jgi:hypothetical protein